MEWSLRDKRDALMHLLDKYKSGDNRIAGAVFGDDSEKDFYTSPPWPALSSLVIQLFLQPTWFCEGCTHKVDSSPLLGSAMASRKRSHIPM